MVVNAIYHGLNQIHRVYHGSKLIFQREPIAFHVVEDDKLIIVGALSAIPFGDGLYLDCQPEFARFHVMEDGKLLLLGAVSALRFDEGLYLDCTPNWEYPKLEGDVLTITQAYSAIMNGNTLEVE